MAENYKKIEEFNKKIQINEKLGLDERDNALLSLMQKDPNISEFKDCPFFLNALITSGKHNLCLLFTATDLKRLEGIVNYHLRGNPKIKNMELNIVISTAKDFVLPLNIDYDNEQQ